MHSRPARGDIPAQPGVYRFRDARGEVIYVGKARSLRQRLGSYFQDPMALHPRTAAMVQAADDVDWVTVGNEVEALSLEYAWIKEFDPRFNVKYRDDKSYPYLAVTLGEEFPRVTVVREAKRKGTRYFGPYAHAWAIRDSVDELLKVFPIRSCRDGVFRRAAQVGRACLLGYIGKCSAPCVGRISASEHRALAQEFCAFMSGQSDRFVRDLERQMRQAADEQRYEEAGRLRDRIGALRRALERNAVVFADGTDADVIGIVDDPLEAAVQVFHVRDGRIRGERGFVLEKAEELDPGEYVDRVLQGVYAQEPAAGYPRQVLLSAAPESTQAWQAWLSEARGSRVDVRVPQRGDLRAIVQTAVTNAERVLAAHRLRRSSDLTSRSLALGELQQALGLAEAPLRIECIDVSTLQGQDTVASLVVFEDALPRKRDYRSYVIRTAGADDTAAVAEVVRRRFARLAEPSSGGQGSPEADTGPDTGPVAEPGTGAVSFAYPPGLLVIDGGRPQVRAAQDALMSAGITDVPVVGLAKRLEEVWLPDSEDPVILPRSSQALYLLQRVRDEAHRTAIALHRKRRGKRQTASTLDGIAGLGPARARSLLGHFGSMRAVRAADAAELALAPGIGPVLAATIHAALHPAESSGGQTSSMEARP
ncbi:MAG: excinuclease ABC subunit UvrC [Actinomycetales bacterium]|nr:excinuclease ABC subunit UvrC [Actinomycetales bacterium]